MRYQKILFSEKKVPVGMEIQGKKKRKAVFKPYSQNQQFLLPKNMDDFIGPGHIARLVSAIIDQMDVQFVIDTYKGGGTSSYDPRMMLKAWILGFITRTYSCRLVAKSLRENLAFIWISGNQTPDFHTLNNFRLRLKADMKKIFKHIVQYALSQGIIQAKDVFVDHTKTEANANKHKVVWRKQVEKQSVKIDQELEELFAYIDELNEQEERGFGNKDLPEQERDGFDDEKVKHLIEKINKNVKEEIIDREQGREQRKKVRRAKQLLERKAQYKKKKEILNGRNSYSKTDTDAVAMMMKDKLTIRPGYNEGVAVENGIVLNYAISDNCADNVSFIPLMEGTIDSLEQVPETTTADAAYGTEENYAYLEKKHIGNYLKYNIYHKEKSPTWQQKKIRLANFTYNKKRDEFICPNDIKLTFQEERQRNTATLYAKNVRKYKAVAGHCSQCPLRSKCTTASARTLEVSWNAERLRQQAKANLNSDKGKKFRKRRGNEVESVFGDQKLNKTKRRYLLRGIPKVNIEAGLYYISHNLRKIQKWFEKKKNKTTQNQKQPHTPPGQSLFQWIQPLTSSAF